MAETIDTTLLKRLSETAGVSGHEGAVRTIVREQMEPVVDSIDSDAMGNLTGIRKGSGKKAPRVMLSAHMDEIGFLVKYVDDKGFLRLQPVGGIDPRQLFAQRVHVTTREGSVLPGVLSYATKPTHLLSEEERKQPPKVENFFVDLGMDAEEVHRQVAVGDMVTMDRTAQECGRRMVGKALDNRVSVFLMIEAMKRLQKCEASILAVASVQEEVGLRGATTAAYRQEPDLAVALDTTLANDHPGPGEADAVTRLGDGPALKIMDGVVLSHPQLVEHFREVAERLQIPVQSEILPRGGTDAGAIQRSREGVPTMTLSIPTRYIHTVNEMLDLQDLNYAIDLLAAFLAEAHQRTYYPE